MSLFNKHWKHEQFQWKHFLKEIGVKATFFTCEMIWLKKEDELQ